MEQLCNEQIFQIVVLAVDKKQTRKKKTNMDVCANETIVVFELCAADVRLDRFVQRKMRGEIWKTFFALISYLVIGFAAKP